MEGKEAEPTRASSTEKLLAKKQHSQDLDLQRKHSTGNSTQLHLPHAVGQDPYKQ